MHLRLTRTVDSNSASCDSFDETARKARTYSRPNAVAQ